jgi:pimeloyl-ACP methyl ester carboxylesterase
MSGFDWRLSRRALGSMLLATAGVQLLPRHLSAQAVAGLRPFKVDIPQPTIDRILNRLRDTQWPDRLETGDWRYGANWDYMKALVRYWIETFDWRKAEANLNRYPQFQARVGDFDIHFYYVKGRGPKPVPLVLTHGWPGSVLEFVEAIGPLSDPASFGGSSEDAFDVVVPSLPGYGFSSKPKDKPIGIATTVALWHRLMTEVLGYPKYGAQGGDLAGPLTAQLAREHPDALIGIHLNGAPAGGPLPPETQQTPEERAWIQTVNEYNATQRDYFGEQRNKPETLAFALTDNPLGVAAWIVEKLKNWSDSPSSFEPAFTKDQVLTNVMIYLLTDTIGTSMWMYRGNADDISAIGGRVNVPTAKVSAAHDIPGLDPPQSILARNYNLVHYTKLPRGGHFAFWEEPELMVADVRAFFRKLRT